MKLTNEQREEIIALLEYYEPLSLREIARECGTSNVTVLNIKKKYCKESPRFYGHLFNYLENNEMRFV
jgi:DNA-directed RNA polymerase specialized sigma subunit